MMQGTARIVVSAVSLLAVTGLAAACSSGSTSSASAKASASKASVSAKASASTMSGTETFSGTEQLTKAQAASDSYVPVIALHATGVFTDTGSIALVPGSGKNGDGAGPATIKLSKGNINVKHAATNPNAQPKQLSGCTYGLTEHVGYTMTSGTAAYAGATGSGTATVKEDFTVPKLANGKCNTANNAVPTGGTVVFSATGPVKLK